MKHVRGASRGGQAVEFGFQLPSRGPLARPDVVTRLARTADALPYSCVTVGDHVVLPTKSSAPYPFDFTVQDPRAMVETMRRFAREIRPKVARAPRNA